MKLYIACALTHVPRQHFREYSDFQHQLAACLSGMGHQVRYALVNSDPQLSSKPRSERARLCYLWDIKMVSEADAVIAECSFPSIGLGIELQHAVENETPIILVYRDFSDNRASPVHYKNPDESEHELQIGEGFVSLMALGLPTVLKVHQYSTTDEGISLVRQALDFVQP